MMCSVILSPLRRCIQAQGLRTALALLGFMLALALPKLGRTEGAVNEHELKAAYLLSLPKYVEWPAASFASADAPFVIGVFGKDPIVDVLKSSLANRERQGRDVTLRHFADKLSSEQLQECHIVYVSAAKKTELADLLAKLGTKPVLTVADYEEFVTNGGMISLVRNGPRIDIFANLDAAEKSHLVISSKFLTRATVVSKK